MNRKKKLILFSAVAAVVVLAIVLTVVLVKSNQKKKDIIIATKEFTESRISGYLFKYMIEGNSDYKVDLKEGLGGTQICFEALKAGEIDGYMEYSGTAYNMFLGLTNEANEDMYETAKEQLYEKYKIVCLEKIGFNDTYRLAMVREKAEEYGITKMSDLIDHSGEFLLASSFEFLEREAGLKKLKADYPGLEFKDEIGVEGTLKYVSADAGEVDLIVAFTTEGMLHKYDMLVLDDDRHSMLDYETFPMFTEKALNDYPGLKEIMNKLAGAISDEDMSYLNYLADVEQQKLDEIAFNFLIERGLINT